MQIGWGRQIRSYVFMPYTLAKDHRTNFEMGNIGAVMDGDLDGFINAYLTALSQGKIWGGTAAFWFKETVGFYRNYSLFIIHHSLKKDEASRLIFFFYLSVLRLKVPHTRPNQT